VRAVTISKKTKKPAYRRAMFAFGLIVFLPPPPPPPPLRTHDIAFATLQIADAFLITEEAQETEDQFYGCAQGAKPLIDMSNWLIDRSGASSIYNGVIFSDTSNASSGLWSYNLMINASNLHGPAVAMNVVNSAILQTITNSTNARIVTRNYPLPNT